MLPKILILLFCYELAYGASVKKSRAKYPFYVSSWSSYPFKDFRFTPVLIDRDRGLLNREVSKRGDQTLTPKAAGIPMASKKNLFKRLSLTFNKQRKDPREVECDMLGGKFVAPDCLEFVNFQLTFEEARQNCQEKGGDLWTPDPTDTFLFFKLGYSMPLFSKAENEKVWVGYGVDTDDPHLVMSVEGEDVSDTFLVQVSDPTDHKAGECLVLNFNHAAFYSSSEPCDKDIEFICEYELTPVVPTVPQDPWVKLRKFLLNFQKPVQQPVASVHMPPPEKTDTGVVGL